MSTLFLIDSILSVIGKFEKISVLLLIIMGNLKLSFTKMLSVLILAICNLLEKYVFTKRMTEL